MTWLRVDVGLAQHRKVARVAAQMRVPRATIVGVLVGCWAYSDTYHPDGDITTADWSHLGEWAGFHRHEAMKQALREAGFIDVTDDGRWVWHDWFDHQGHSVERRRKNAERMRNERAGAKHVQRTSDAHVQHVRSTFDTTHGRTDGRTEHAHQPSAPDGAMDPRKNQWLEQRGKP